jgi:hypothetical protein
MFQPMAEKLLNIEENKKLTENSFKSKPKAISK